MSSGAFVPPSSNPIPGASSVSSANGSRPSTSSNATESADVYRTSLDNGSINPVERPRSSSADSTRYSFVHMDAEPGISSVYTYLAALIPAILTLTAISLCLTYGDPTQQNGLPRDIFTYTGSSLSLIGGLGVFVSDKYMTHWKVHPNPLIYWKMVADFMLAFVAMSTQAANHIDIDFRNITGIPDVTPTQTDDRLLGEVVDDEEGRTDDGCSYEVAALTQFCMLSSETWFFIMAIDLLFSLRNPFTSYKNKYPRYHTLSWGLGLITAITLYNEGLAGTSTADICWVIDEDTGDVWGRNMNAIIFLYSWMCFYFIISIVVFVMTICRLNGGLKSTYQSRKYVLTRTSTILCIFMIYWAVMGMLYVFGVINPEAENPKEEARNNAATGIIWALLPAKGFITAIVWFSVNSLPSFLYHSLSREGRAKLETKRLRFVGGDFSPQLNKALRREVLHFTTKGIIEAVSRNPNRPPSNWAMNALASNRVVAEFDIELEDKEHHQLSADDNRNIIDVEAADPKDPIAAGWKCCASTFETATKIETTRRVKFKDYYPHVFARIRAAFGVSVGSYVKSLKKTAKEKLSAGASGAFMFFTRDGKYLVKSCSEDELKCLLRILVHYADYLVKNKASFLTRFYGCHSIRMYGRDYSFVVMANIFNTDKVINQSYDIKGSWINRNADPIVKGKKVRCRHCNKMYIYRGPQGGNGGDGEEQCAERVRGCQPNVVLKDSDLNDKIRLEVSDAEKTIEQLVADSELLGSLGIMDYSLIMGVCNTEYEVQDHKPSTRWPHRTRRQSIRTSIAPKVKKRQSEAGSITDRLTGSERHQRRFNSNMSSASDGDRESLRGDESVSSSRGIRFQSDAELYEEKDSEFMMRSRCVVGPEFVFMGMIDMLQEWTLKKQLERFAKMVFKRQDGDGISAIEPIQYKRRFQQKIRAIFSIDEGQYYYESPQIDVIGPGGRGDILSEDGSEVDAGVGRFEKNLDAQTMPKKHSHISNDAGINHSFTQV